MTILDRLRARPGLPAWDEQATDADIYYCYRLILQREPDAEGTATYRQLVARGLPFRHLARIFLNSDEYRQRLAEAARPVPVDLGGYTVCVQALDTDFAQGILASHDYEPHVRAAVRGLVREGDVSVDVGANVGCITFLAATLAGPSGLVVAVEPNPDNLQMLYAGIVANGLANVRVLPFAASTGHEVLSLVGGTSNTHVVSARGVAEGGYYVESAPLDEQLAWLPRLDFVKMDIEGHEPTAFEGMRQLLERFRPALVVEFNPRCLVDHLGVEPARLADQIFGLYPRARALSAFGDDVEVARTADLIALWERRNREVADAGLLPDRMLHFDLVVPRP